MPKNVTNAHARVVIVGVGSVQMAWCADIPSTAYPAEGKPGYYYDPKTKRYFRGPPRRLAYMSPGYEATPMKAATPPSQHKEVPTSLFSLTSHISTCLDPPGLSTVAATSARTSRRHAELMVVDSDQCFSHVVTHMRLNMAGNMVAIHMLTDSQDSLLLMCKLSYSTAGRIMELCPFHQEVYAAQYMMGSPVGICKNGQSEVVVYYKNRSVVARKFKPGLEDEASTVVGHTPSRHAARWTLPTYGGHCSSDALCCTSSLSSGALGAISNSNGVVYVLGLPNSSCLVETERRQTPDKSTVFSIEFNDSPLILYAGTRSGTILTWDLRAKSSTKMCIRKSDKLNPSVVQLHALDNNYLISNSMSSKLLLWDCRMNRQILTYPGYSNTYQPCQSVVDESQSILAAVSEDKTIRVWSVWTGNLLRCIQETEYVKSDRQPEGSGGLPKLACSNSEEWTGGLPTLLVATRNTITSFSV